MARISNALLRGIIRAYRSVLQVSLRRPWVAVATALVLFVAGAVMIARVESEFLPQVDDGRVMVKLMKPTGTAVGETDRVLAEIERQLEGQPEIQSMYTLAGGKFWGLYTYEIASEGDPSGGRPADRGQGQG